MESQEMSIFLGGIWFALTVVGDWLLFRKADRPGILSLIPVVNVMVEYSLCWSGAAGLCYFLSLIACYICGMFASESLIFMIAAGVLALVVVVISWMESRKLARAFGRSGFFALLLFLFGRPARVFLGLSNARYRGKR